ncbi:MAG: hypothetical protein ABI806_07705 [Candidatus Solibacter sp.]
MSNRRKYIKRATAFVTAVQIKLELDGFTYRKWGGTQHCSRGDWLVDNNGDVYTVESESFARTYRQTGPGTYVKTTPVWAEVASVDGETSTKEGATHFVAGDYLVYNEPDGGDGYAVTKGEFDRMYEPVDL